MDENNNKVLAIMDLAMKISQNSETDIFVEYSPHIKAIRLYGYTDGWKNNAVPDMFNISRYVWLEGELYDEKLLDSVLAELEKFWEGIQNGQTES